MDLTGFNLETSGLSGLDHKKALLPKVKGYSIKNIIAWKFLSNIKSKH
jgi:hypothetical protein